MNTAQAICRCLCAAMLLTGVAARAADDPGRISVLEENDGVITHKDRYYTQGLQVSYLSSDLTGHEVWNKVFDAVGWALPMYRDPAGVAQRRFEYIPIAQAEFTPEVLDTATPDPKDRPYAAWLYTGLHLLQENNQRSLNNLEVLAGVVGPDAFGRQVQDGYHNLAGFHQADGWDHQIRNRAAFQFSYDYKRRLDLDFGSRYQADIIPEAGISVGNVYRYLDAGAMLRFGNALDIDYGPEHIRPSLSGTAFSDYRRLGGSWFHWYLYAGVQERRMFYNLFIDASDEVAPQGIGRTPFVSDFFGGASIFFGHIVRADFVATRRTREFYGQDGADVFGGVNLTFDP
jgi:lipid A 3-O-deacylase